MNIYFCASQLPKTKIDAEKMQENAMSIQQKLPDQKYMGVHQLENYLETNQRCHYFIEVSRVKVMDCTSHGVCGHLLLQK